MRDRNERDYPLIGEVFIVDQETQTESEIPVLFNYKAYQGKASEFVREEQIGGFTTVGEGRLIETISGFEFKVGYRIKLDTGLYKIKNIAFAEDDTIPYARYRNTDNRFKKVLVLS